MNIASAKRQIKDTVEAYLQRDDAGMHVIEPVHQRPIFLLGAPGIGKTAIMEQVAQELGIGIVSYSMTHHTRQSALGLPRIEHREFEGYEYESSEYTMSEIVGSVYDYMKRSGTRKGILFLDEINCVSETLYPSMLQFLQFKTFGKHRVPEDWVVVCAGNPPEYNRSVHEFDIVTMDRLREIQVEPEYGAWKTYAHAKGVHPAVTSFLEAKQDCFYKVESRPGGGKSFVTARGWEDLAEVIALYESLDKPVNRDLFVQFLRDDEIADAFSVYYTLFQKYRSDYQVANILAGDATLSIKNRARDAEFDERIALMGLLLDALAASCNAALDQEGIVTELRDLLRLAKPELLAGATVEDAVVARMTERERTLARKIDAGVIPKSKIRKERLVLGILRDMVALCGTNRTPEGEMAFFTIETAYKEQVAKIKELVAEANAKLDNAFDFVEECFGNREMLVFVAELTTRQATTTFVSHYGNQKYFAHNEGLKVDATISGLTERVKNLGVSDHPQQFDASGAAGSTGDAIRMGSAISANWKVSEQQEYEQGMERYYCGKAFEWGFASMSKMTLPDGELRGKRVLDVCCRRGKGVYKLSAKVGAQGWVTGVDWQPTYIEDAQAGQDRAWHDNGLKASNMEFRVAYPEDLIHAGIGTETQDVVYINNVMTLLYDQPQALREFHRVLKPGGLLIMETTFADRERDPKVVEGAREIGNSIQAALTKEQNLIWLREAGFQDPEVKSAYAVGAARGFQAGTEVGTVEDVEDVQYQAVALYVRK
ncbi:MAG: methyltransferase domain-containing protein [Coriobacteriia bacterium]|nr:methyltransferase domain-containing protein [Coriobacteriia bacterium]